MNWDVIEGKWKQFAGSARSRWGKLTDSDWDVICGKKDKLTARPVSAPGGENHNLETHTVTKCSRR